MRLTLILVAALCIFGTLSFAARPIHHLHRFPAAPAAPGETYRAQNGVAFPVPADRTVVVKSAGQVLHTGKAAGGTAKLSNGVSLTSSLAEGEIGGHFQLSFTKSAVAKTDRWLQFISRGAVRKSKATGKVAALQGECKGKSGQGYTLRGDADGNSPVEANWGVDTSSPIFKNSLGAVADDPVRGNPFYEYGWAHLRTATEASIYDKPSPACDAMGADAFTDDTEYIVTRAYFVDFLMTGKTPVYKIAHYLEWKFTDAASWKARNKKAADLHKVSDHGAVTDLPPVLKSRFHATYPDFVSRADVVPQ